MSRPGRSPAVRSPLRLALALAACALALRAGAAELDLAAFGAVGDGVADDGPALVRATAALARQGGPVTLRCAAGRTYRVASGSGWALRLDGLHQVTVEGGGSTLLLAGELRGIGIHQASAITVRGLRIDYATPSCVEGLVTAKDEARRSVDVQVAAGGALPPAGGPTREGGEQAWFAMLWDPGPYALLGTHFPLDDLQPLPGGDGRSLRAQAGGDFHGFAAIVPGATRISLPVRGLAHRPGPGAVLEVDGSRDVLVEDVEIWSAPWFACRIQRNEGTVAMRRVMVRPRPGSGRLTSSWRDGVHVKGNRAALRFEDCVIEGTNDDAFNIATYVSRIESATGAVLRVRQSYPLDYVAMRVGDTLAGYATATGDAVGPARVVAIEEQPGRAADRAPAVILHLDHALAGALPGDVVWAVEAADPDTRLTRCVLRNSCRFQAPVTLDGCDAIGFLWFYGESLEGPLPSGSLVRRCRLRVGRGNPELAVACSGVLRGPPRAPAPPRALALHGLRFEDNDIAGIMEFDRAGGVDVRGNRFDRARGRLVIRECRGVVVDGNRLGDQPLAGSDRITIKGPAATVTVR